MGKREGVDRQRDNYGDIGGEKEVKQSRVELLGNRRTERGLRQGGIAGK